MFNHILNVCTADTTLPLELKYNSPITDLPSDWVSPLIALPGAWWRRQCCKGPTPSWHSVIWRTAKRNGVGRRRKWQNQGPHPTCLQGCWESPCQPEIPSPKTNLFIFLSMLHTPMAKSLFLTSAAPFWQWTFLPLSLTPAALLPQTRWAGGRLESGSAPASSINSL